MPNFIKIKLPLWFILLFNVKTSIQYMIIIEVKDSESIERALKRYKLKHRKIGLIKELRARKHFTKPSIKRRGEVLSAVYRLKKFST